jgi:hypothetical protein
MLFLIHSQLHGSFKVHFVRILVIQEAGSLSSPVAVAFQAPQRTSSETEVVVLDGNFSPFYELFVKIKIANFFA